MLTPHSTRRIYSRVEITHLLHRVSQTRTYYNKYGLRPSNTKTAEGLEDKVSPSTPTASLSERSRPKAPYCRLKSLQHEHCSPKMGQHMEYAGNVTHRE